MLQVSSPVCTPFCQKDSREETRFSFPTRVTSIAIGSIAAAVGLLVVCQVPMLSSLGTTAGATMLPIGLCLALVGSFVKYVKKPHMPISHSSTVDRPVFQTEPITQDIWLSIFSLLPPSDIVNCSMVCKNWSRISNNEELWKFICLRKPNLLADFAPIVASGKCNWKEVHFKYSPFSSLLSNILKRTICQYGKLIRDFNPQLVNQYHLSTIIPAFFVKYGEYRFFINNGCDVKVKKGNKEYILQGKSERLLTHLAVEGDCLFALMENGMVLQWHYLTEEPFQEIPTAYAKNDLRLQKIKKETDEVCTWEGSFYVNNGYIVLSYGDGRHKACEVISYNNSRKSHLIINKDLFNTSHILIKDEKLFLADRNDIFIWDLQKQSIIKKINLLNDDSNFICDFAVKEHILYATSSSKIEKGIRSC